MIFKAISVLFYSWWTLFNLFDIYSMKFITYFEINGWIRVVDSWWGGHLFLQIIKISLSYSTDRPAFWNLEQNWSSILTIKRFDTLTTSMISIETQWFKDFLVHNIFWTCELWHIDFLLITLEKQRLLIFFELGK